MILDADERLLGVGHNHRYRDATSMNRKTRVVHAEANAVADVIHRRGEDSAFAAFPSATVFIVELMGGVSYEDAPP